MNAKQSKHDLCFLTVDMIQIRQVKPSVGGSKSTSPDRKLEATMISKDLGALEFLVFILVATSEGEIYGGRRKGIQLPPITLVQFWQKFLKCYAMLPTLYQNG